jgi:glutamate N-acetyltransferase / amino-acid N-acetyltransferase
MPVGLKEPESLLPVKGIRMAAIAAGIKSDASKDLVLFELDEGSKCSAVFTQNAFCAAPVTLSKQHINSQPSRYLLINSGNANAGTGKQGINDAQQCCSWLAKEVQCSKEEVLIFSTGVIGENLPMTKFESGLPQLVSNLSDDSWLDAGRGIMTTDTLLKGVSRQLELDGKIITITGISKGSGMVRPDMATMLAFIATDAAISKSMLDQCINEAVSCSFNSITVDGDTSTNDSCVLIATGKVEMEPITVQNSQYDLLNNAITEVFESLAKAIIRDAEGATKFITLDVVNALSENDARSVAYTIAHSPLVKTALFASDPNWGRILAAVGRSGVEMDLEKIEIFLDDVCIVNDGGRSSGYTEEQGQAIMFQEEIIIKIDMNAGTKSARIWTSDLSYDYVKINAEYRT